MPKPTTSPKPSTQHQITTKTPPKTTKPAAATNVIEVRHLTKIYKNPKTRADKSSTNSTNNANNTDNPNALRKTQKTFKAVDDLSFDVKEGEILGLLGPNGSGKSTTINCLLSLLKFDKGTIKIFGETMAPASYDLKRQIGVIFQDVAVFDELRAEDNIDFFCGLYIKDKTERQKCVDDAIKLVGLKDFRKFYPKQLSGGLLRRLNIACGIAHKPKLIFLDEPTVAVDPQSRQHILDNIETLRKHGATVIYTTHYMEEVEQICDRIIILDKGKIIASGTNAELKKLVKNKPVKQVVGPTLNDVFLELTGKELRD